MEDSAGLCWEHFGGNKETQGTYHYAVPQVPTSLESPPSFHLSDILAWFVVLWPGFFSRKREDKEEWDYTILTEHQRLPCSVGYESACHTVVNSKKKYLAYEWRRYCQLMVIGTNSIPTGIPNLKCTEEGNFIQHKLLNSETAWLWKWHSCVAVLRSCSPETTPAFS